LSFLTISLCFPQYSQLFPKIQRLWSELCSAARPFMVFQENSKNFEFYGFDVIVDEVKNCWLIEVNRLPGLESSKNNLAEEDQLYNEMMSSVLQMILFPEWQKQKKKSSEENNSYCSIPMGFWTNVTEMSETEKKHKKETQALEIQYSNKEKSRENENYKNMLKWKLLTRLKRKEILAVYH
jgi:hypothetical protein